jgi:hypothetical protein
LQSAVRQGKPDFERQVAALDEGRSGWPRLRAKHNAKNLPDAGRPTSYSQYEGAESNAGFPQFTSAKAEIEVAGIALLGV